MTRDQIIAHLQLHGYELSRNFFEWVAIWNPVTREGRLVKKFERGWDVRPIISDLAINNHHEWEWRFVDEELARVFVDPVPPKYQHDMDGIIETAVQTKGAEL